MASGPVFYLATLRWRNQEESPRRWTDLEKSILEKDPRKPEKKQEQKERRSPYSQLMYSVLFCKDNNICG